MFSGKRKYHLSRYYKKDHFQGRIFWKDHLFRIFEENIIFPGFFFEKYHLSFCAIFPKHLEKENMVFRAVNDGELFLQYP